MPRGNDPTARGDIAAQYGEGHGNAEDLIRSHDDGLDVELNKALSKPVDPAATEALDLSNVKPKHGGTIMSAVIRGGRLVAVEDVEGHYVKWHDDVPGAKRSGGSKVDSGAQGQKDRAVRGQAENPTGDPSKNDGGTGAAGGSSGDENAGGTGDTGTGDTGTTGADDGSGDAPEHVTVPMIREKLDARGIHADRETRKKDDLWALLPADAQAELSEGGSTPS